MSSHSATTTSAFDGHLASKFALACGFLAIALAALAARSAPATGYEVSIFASTPTPVWAGIGVALFVAVFAALTATTDRGVRGCALALGGLATVLFAGLPLVRNYLYYGYHDALTHLGWARALEQGSILPFDLTYPGIHTTGVYIGSVLEIPIARAMVFVTVVAALLFFVFVPLSVRAIVPDARATALAAFGAFLLLPITTIATHHHPHAMTQAIMFSAAFVYVLTRYLRSDPAENGTAFGAALALASVAAVVFHPQLVAHLLAVAVGICLVQFLARRFKSEGAVTRHRTLYGHTLFLFAVFLLWTANNTFYFDTVEYIASRALEFVLGVGEAGASIGAQGASLSEIGVSMAEIFAKLFGPHLVLSVLAAGLLAGVLVGVRTRYDHLPAMATYYGVGLVALGTLFVVYFVASGSEIYFRVLGLMMVFVVILGSIAISLGYDALSSRIPSTVAGSVVGLTVLALLVMSLLAVFPSPYIYHASPHVTETTASGYETAFAAQDDDVEMVGFRGTTNRFDDAIHGNEERMRAHGSVSEETFDEGLTEYYDEDRYLIVTEADYQREQVAYQELRYGDGEIEAATSQPGVSRVLSNDEFELYYVHAEGTFA
ncbi:hypothetical protein [Halopiger goleimassiliensis]|uniref:hypothetical protein n=1 Tax=Halopiger goleimassiliensis TaxID=1293048 RepID=UPI00067771FF|nr:hypothetical protein [Halopiger goleimassiliensis]